MSISEHISDYLAAGKLLQLATVDEAGKPNVVHVWYATMDGASRLVFTSNKSRFHSGHIRENGLSAGAIIAIELQGLGQKVQGLTFSGRAVEAVGELSRSAYEAYAAKWPQVTAMFSAEDIQSDATPMRMYVVEVSEYVLFDEVRYPSQPRQQLNIG